MDVGERGDPLPLDLERGCYIFEKTKVLFFANKKILEGLSRVARLQSDCSL